MKQGTQVATIENAQTETASSMKYYVELTKPRITSMVLITVGAAGYVASPAGATLLNLFNVILGTFFIAASGSAFNQYLERYTDFMMKRTAKRPLPSSHLSARQVTTFGSVTLGIGLSYLFLQVSILAAALGLLTWVLYVLVYTPMKVKTSWNTFVGAIAGALPVLMGAAGTTSSLNLQSWLFFAVLFVWQFPHFMAIAWLYKKDYGKSGLVMLTVTDESGRASGWLAVWMAIAMYLVCLPLAFNMQGVSQAVFMIASIVLCSLYLWPSIRYLQDRSDQTAKKLLRASVIFLPLFMIFLAVCQG
ncbi:MAG: heme o synthase [Planctomycetota bacterium]|mgnify:CR=1 FL=1|nr:heme o synthase [Planctomycetota bacterium]